MRPSPRDLIERLKEKEGARTNAELARRLGVSERDLYRWKSGDGPNYNKTLELLERAGVLRWSIGRAKPATPEGVTVFARCSYELEAVEPGTTNHVGFSLRLIGPM